ncbi:MAG TPA: L,D-transpeptidase [Polyangiaceae bacterium]|nr:L,D-transpeptidase [Polyangiaceae bacterium]
MTASRRVLLLSGAALALTLGAGPGAAAGEGLPASVEVTRPDEPIHVRPDGASPRRGAAARGARLPAFAATGGPGCEGAWFEVGPLAWICEDGAARSPLPPGTAEAPAPSGLPFDYHFVGRDGSFGYRVLDTAEEGEPDAQLFPGFGVALVRVAAKPGGDAFGLTTHRLWVPLRDLNAAVRAPEPLAADLDGADVAWVTAPRAELFASAGGRPKSGATVEALARVPVLERVEKHGETWLRVGDGAWLRGRDATWPSVKAPPAEAAPDERWIDVDLARQVLVAYRGERPLFAMPVSTGRGPVGTELATPPGVHRVWIKLATSDMDNLEDTDAARNYAIQAVPWVMYFDRGYGLHGAFWHHAFGHVMSHGCVNLTPADAARLFAWTSPHLPSGWSAVLPTEFELGTLVRVE